MCSDSSGRALSTSDLETLASEASPAVAVARALPARSSDGRRRPGHVDLRVRLLRIEDLFQAPDLDPFRAEHAGYDERPGVEQMLSRLYLAKPKATATVTIELPEGQELPPDADARASAAMVRYCRRKIALVDDEIESSRRLEITPP